MSCACKGYICTTLIRIKAFDSKVKQKVLNDEKKKTLKTSENGTRLCHVSAFHYDFKILLFQSLTFQQTEYSVLVILLVLEWHKHLEQFSKSII